MDKKKKKLSTKPKTQSKSSYVKWVFFLLFVFFVFEIKDTFFQTLPAKQKEVSVINVKAKIIRAENKSIPITTYGLCISNDSHIQY